METSCVFTLGEVGIALGTTPQEIVFHATDTNIGRSKSHNGVVLRCNNLTKVISRVHARVQYDEGEHTWVIKDANSINGTFVNGVKVDESCLSDGDIVRLGGDIKDSRDAQAFEYEVAISMPQSASRSSPAGDFVQHMFYHTTVTILAFEASARPSKRHKSGGNSATQQQLETAEHLLQQQKLDMEERQFQPSSPMALSTVAVPLSTVPTREQQLEIEVAQLRQQVQLMKEKQQQAQLMMEKEQPKMLESSSQTADGRVHSGYGSCLLQ